MPLPAYDRWERQLIARGGYQKKRSGRFTKPGSRPRENVFELRPSTTRDQVPRRDTDPTGGDVIWVPYVHEGNTVTTTSGAYAGTGTANWYWDDNSTSATTTTGVWINTTGTEPYTWDGTGGAGWQSVPTRFESYHRDLTPEQRKEIERAARVRDFQQRIREQVTGGHSNQWKQRLQADFSQVSQPEIVALQLLKKMLPTDEWRRYLRYGFVIVHSPVTGLDYQVFRGGGHIKVYRRGKPVAELCIHISDRKTPPTDRVIAKKIMLEATELEVWLKSNIHCCRGLGYKKPTIEDLVRLGGEGLVQDIRSEAVVGEEQTVTHIFTPEAARRSMEPIHIIGDPYAREFVQTGYVQTA